MGLDGLARAITPVRVLLLLVIIVRRRIMWTLGLASRVRLDYTADSVSVGKRKLLDLVKECPSLYGKRAIYTPFPLLGGGHAATIWSALGDFSTVDDIKYERRLLRLPDGGTISLDFTPPLDVLPPDDRPMLICIHGLTGGSHESYVRSVLAQVTASTEKGGLGWRGLVVNARGCANTPVTSPALFHAGWTSDLRRALLYVQTIMPNAPLYGVGFSLGANILSRYLGEEGDRTPLKAAVACSSPWNLWKGHVALGQSTMGRLYSRAMSKNLRLLLKRNLEAFRDDKRLDLDCIFGNENATLYEFDSQVVRKLNGFASTEEYYMSQSATLNLDQVRIPLLGLHALNDPITAHDAIPKAESKYFIMATTQQGGHLGWWSGWPKRRWLPKPICEFVSAIQRADPTARPHPTTPIAGEDGTTIDKERPEIGFKLVQTGEHLSGGDENGTSGAMKGF